MAGNTENSTYFTERKAKGQLIVRDPPKFDLESYIANYAGYTRLARLTHIGTTSTFLAVDALHLAIREAKQGKNVTAYLELCDILHGINPDDPEGNPDLSWVDRKTRTLKAEAEKLESELKTYKNNLIKESIRMGHEDLGQFYYETGDFSNSYKSYHKMRDYCTSAKHVADMNLRAAMVNIAQRNWMGLQSSLVKIEAQAMKNDDRQQLMPITFALSGLANMSIGNYSEAASAFLRVDPSYIALEPAAKIQFQKEVLTANDIAVYGGLCALASMDRGELQRRVLENNVFRQFLELEPHIRRAISLFCSSKYTACLDILEAYRADYLLDIYLQPRLVDLYSRVRSKSIVQYFIPFSCVSLDDMAKAFPNTAGDLSIEDELVKMIQDGKLNARIDLVDRLLIAPTVNPRHEVHYNALKMAQDYEHALKVRLMRLSMQYAGLEIKAPKQHQHNFQESDVFGSSALDPRKSGAMRLG